MGGQHMYTQCVYVQVEQDVNINLLTENNNLST